MYKGKRKVVQVKSLDEINDIIAFASKRSRIHYNAWEKRDQRTESLTNDSYVVDKDKYIEVTTKYYKGSKTGVTYRFDKTGEDDVVAEVTGLTAIQTLQSYYKAPDFRHNPDLKKLGIELTDRGTFTPSAAPLTYYNKKHSRTRRWMWCYDLNSAYAAQMLRDIPDTSHYELNTAVKEGQIGFLTIDGLPLVHKGFANVVFDLMPSPYTKFVEKYYGAKHDATDKQAKKNAKDMLVFGVGYLQRINPFLRAFIVNSCNEFIKQYMDEDTCISNTDSIFSLRERPDLPIGEDIGQFKLEFQGPVAYIGHTYQRGNELPKARHIVAQRYKEDFDLLKDPLPTMGALKYRFNKEANIVEQTPDFKEEESCSSSPLTAQQEESDARTSETKTSTSPQSTTQTVPDFQKYMEQMRKRFLWKI